MKSYWRRCTLEEAGISLIDCDHKTPIAYDEGYPYIGIPQMQNGMIDPSSARRISHADFVQWTRKAKPKLHDIILSRRCNPGEIAVVPANVEWALGQNLVLLRSDGTRVFPPFLQWLVQTPNWWAEVSRYINVGAVFDSLKCKDIPQFEVDLPSIPYQQAIHAVLGAIKEKIEINQEMNKTLEGMARAVFKDWFVDSGPVKAKERGERPIGPDGEPMSDELLSLFPDRIDPDTGFPEGWREKTVGDFCSAIYSGGTPSTNVAEYWGGDYPWFSSGETSEPLTIKAEKSITELGIKNSSTRPATRGDILIASAGQGKTRGQTTLNLVDLYINQSVVSVRVDPTKGGAGWMYICLSGRYEEMRAISDAHSSRGSLTTKLIGALPMISPPSPEIIFAFEKVFQSLLAKMESNLQENQTLSDFRDTLLPKLMSGEVSVEEIKTIGFADIVPSQPKTVDLFGEVALTPDEEFERETVMVAAAVKALQVEDQVVGNVRYQKAFYFARRKMGLPVDDFLPKAAGPYNHEMRYGGGYEEALKRQFIRTKRSGDIEGNVTASKIAEIEPLVAKYQMGDAISWVRNHLRGKSRDELELWATVDQAALLLGKMDKEVNVGTVVELIDSIPEWKPKLNRSIFSRPNIAQALGSLSHLLNAY